MKKLIVLLCLLLIPALTASDTSTYVLAVSGQDAGSGTCSDAITQSTSDGYMTLGDSTSVAGQSFTGDGKVLCSITLKTSSATATGGLIEMRVDDDTDMSSEYLATKTVECTTAEADMVFDFEVDEVSLSSETTYYFSIMNTNGEYSTRFRPLQAGTGNPYNGGVLYFYGETAWNLTTPAADMDFYFTVSTK